MVGSLVEAAMRRRQSEQIEQIPQWRTCDVDDCPMPAARAGLCWGHIWQRKSGLRLRPLRRYNTPAQRISEARIALDDAVESGDRDRIRVAKERLRSAKRQVRQRGQPPRRTRA